MASCIVVVSVLAHSRNMKSLLVEASQSGKHSFQEAVSSNSLGLAEYSFRRINNGRGMTDLWIISTPTSDSAVASDIHVDSARLALKNWRASHEDTLQAKEPVASFPLFESGCVEHDVITGLWDVWKLRFRFFVNDW